jgi:hypothetical protein
MPVYSGRLANGVDLNLFFSENHMKQIHCVGKMQSYLLLEAGGTYSYCWALKG